jgi:hypothetical protein
MFDKKISKRTNQFKVDHAVHAKPPVHIVEANITASLH